MSTYLTATGLITFPNTENLMKAVKVLTKGKWLSQEDNGAYVWVDEQNQPIHHDNPIDTNTKEISIPYGYYRNLSRVMDKVLSYASGGRFKCYTTDGYYNVKSWVNGDFSKYVGDQIARLAKTQEERDIDVLHMQSEEWERKHESDFNEVLTDVLEAALARL